jgi:hypothetical protein
MTEAATLISCQWCEKPFQARRGGGSPQRFCGAACRTAFWTALRRCGERAIAAGILTIDELKNDGAAACTLLGCRAPPLPLLNNGRAQIALPNAPLKFVAEVERDTVAWLVKLRFPPDRGHDFYAILAALKRVGLAPTISRVA